MNTDFLEDSGTATGELISRILIAHGSDLVRRGLLALLEKSFPEIAFGVAGTCAELLAEIERRTWRLVILDPGITEGKGLDAIAEIKAKSGSKVLVLFSIEGDDWGVRAIQGGADGCLRRDATVEELVEAIGRLLQGHRYVSADLAERIAEVLARPRVSGMGSLSNRELHVLRRIGQGRTTGEIAREMNLSVKTISTYRSRVLEKLHLHTTAELVRFALENRITD